MQSILIVGAGPTGLTLAAVLARYGVRARLIDERVTPPEDRSRAIVLQARTMELFRDLGIDEEVMAEALRVDDVTLYLPSGKRGSLTIRPEWIQSRFNRITSLPQDETERILTGLLHRNGIEIERGVKLTSAEERDGAVACVLTHADGHAETISAHWVVGADGAHSAVRRAAGLSFDGETYNDEAMLGDVDMKWSLGHSEITLCPGGSGFLLSFPLPGEHRFRIIIIRPAAAPAEARQLEREEFMQAVREMLPRTERDPVLLTARWLTRYRLHRRGVPSYSRGRFFVAGDAAHVHSPVGAQGMNTGIQDSYNLGWKLALVARGDARESILASYNEERHPVGQKLLKGTDLAFGFLARGGFIARFMRRLLPGVGVRLIVTGALGKRLARLVSQTTIRYRHSTMVIEGPHASELPESAPRAGDRLPDFAFESGEWLHDLVAGPDHVLLVVEPRQASMPATELDEFTAASRVPVRVVHLDTTGRAGGMAGERGAMYLVRPDKHIGFRGTLADLPALGSAMHSWFA